MTNQYGNPWTEERVELLKALWAKGDSCSEIARQLGGCTRNAVIGKVNRLNLKPRGGNSFQNQVRVRKAPAPREPKAKRARPNNFAGINTARRVLKVAVGSDDLRRTPAELRAAAFTPLTGSAPKPWIERAFGECSWPVGGDRADTLSCCQPVVDRDWCAYHLALGTRPTPSSQRTGNDLMRSLRRWAA